MNKYWFRKRRGLFSRDLGRGFVPITAEGYFVVFAWLIFIVGLCWLYVFQPEPLTDAEQLQFVGLLLSSVILVSLIGWFKCE